MDRLPRVSSSECEFSERGLSEFEGRSGANLPGKTTTKPEQKGRLLWRTRSPMHRKFSKAIVCTTALCLLTSSGVAFGAQSDRSSQSQQGQRQNTSSQQRQTISGTVDSVRQAEWVASSGQREKRAITRLELENGRTEFVDVGSQSKLRNLGLNSGDEIQLRGQYATVGGRRVFMADQIRVDGEMFTVQRSQQQRQGSQARTQSMRSSQASTRSIQGTVQGFRHVFLRPSEGQREQHSLVKVQLQNGRTLVVDLGPRQKLDDVKLRKGQRITVQGRTGRIDGRPVFFAEQLKVGDQTLRIARASSLSGSSAQASSSSGGQQSGQFTVRGKVAGYQVVTLHSGQQQVSILNLALEDGRSVLIDAGTKRAELNLKELDLRDQAIIKGHTKNVQGRQVLVADSIQFVSPSQQQSQQGAMGGSGQEQQSSGGSSSSGQSQQEQQQKQQQEQ
jgi:hypothetical protein